MGCKAVKDGDDNYLSINCYYEVGREDQKNYCLALVKKWDNPKDIKYVIKENPGKLLDSIIYNQIDVPRAIDKGECCFTSSNSRLKNATNESYGNLIFEILNGLSIKKSPNARKVTDIL